jgi:hypothetical protein
MPLSLSDKQKKNRSLYIYLKIQKDEARKSTLNETSINNPNDLSMNASELQMNSNKARLNESGSQLQTHISVREESSVVVKNGIK